MVGQTNSTNPLSKTGGGISTAQADIFRLVNFVTISALIGLFGIFSNVVNIIVFYKQGFTTTTNISFFALAISDLLCLITIEWYDICLNPYFETDEIPFIPKEVQYLTGGWFHVCFGRITSWITVFITAERCLGVALPLKVKCIITLRRTTVAMCAIFTVNLIMLVPEYSIAHLDWKFVAEKNKSFVGLVYRSNKNELSGLVFTLTSTSGILSFITVTILTAFLVVKLAQKSQWRNVATGGAESSETTSTKDKKIMKMIVMIASILILCYTPGTAASLVTTIEPEFMVGGKYANPFFAIWSVAFVFNALNSSVNMVLYYNMSTRYKQSFNELFAGCRKDSPEALTTCNVVSTRC